MVILPSGMAVVPFRWDKDWREVARKFLSKCDESLGFLKSCSDPLILGMAYLVIGAWQCFFGFQYVEDEKEQEEYLDKGLTILEKALVLAGKTRDSLVIIQGIFWLDWWALFGGRFEYIQKRIFDDLNEIVKVGKIYANSHFFLRFETNFLPAFYYSNFAQRSFFSAGERKSYAQKGIEHAKESLHTSSFILFSGAPYQALTWSYSQLAILVEAKSERDEYATKMLQSAKEAEQIAEKVKGGYPRAVGYSSLYRAYKTLADIADNEEERSRMLAAAIDAHKKYIEHAVESRTGIILVQMRLGLLYEELGITTGKTDPLVLARESFLHVIKESLERGYHFYSAAAHISAAHVEDRLGDHVKSAEHYERAIDAYEASSRSLEYRPLKDRVQEVTNYARAWNLIERAKAYHKREDHLPAKENYEKASRILAELPSYSYEASYYSAWASQEEAEQLSKQENHEEAIATYETTIKGFDDSMKILENACKRATDRTEKERIERLGKLAKARMSYCLARANIERARTMGKRGEHLEAAERFASAASQFREVIPLFKIERERGELEAVYNLCRAWESMELAEKYEDPDRFAEAANLFAKASQLFTDSKLKLLASGNSAFCQALEYGRKFDESTETQVKAQLYPKIKVILRKAASSYGKGGFESGADWALATSTYFDAAWHLIRADEEMMLDEKGRLLKVGSEILKSAAELFGKAGYKHKEKEALERLEIVEKEEKILFSALNTIREPSISKSTIGIVAPASPIETSLSPRIHEVRQITEEAKRVAEEKTREKAHEDKREEPMKEATEVKAAALIEKVKQPPVVGTGTEARNKGAQRSAVEQSQTSPQTSARAKAISFEAFICYKRDTAEDFAEHLKTGLEISGIHTFLDTKDIPNKFRGKEEWTDAINGAIVESRTFLLIITAGFESSSEIRRELSLARESAERKFVYFRHKDLAHHIKIDLDNEELDIGKQQQLPFDTKQDLLRQALRILKRGEKRALDTATKFL
jgi:hypothetical protein